MFKRLIQWWTLDPKSPEYMLVHLRRRYEMLDDPIRTKYFIDEFLEWLQLYLYISDDKVHCIRFDNYKIHYSRNGFTIYSSDICIYYRWHDGTRIDYGADATWYYANQYYGLYHRIGKHTVSPNIFWTHIPKKIMAVLFHIQLLLTMYSKIQIEYPCTRSLPSPY